MPSLPKSKKESWSRACSRRLSFSIRTSRQPRRRKSWRQKFCAPWLAGRRCTRQSRIGSSGDRAIGRSETRYPRVVPAVAPRSPDDPMTRSPDTMTAKERERAFLFGAPLAIVPSLIFLPAVMFLIVFPQVAARARDWADGGAGLRPRELSRAMEAGLGRGREAVGNLQRPEFWGAVHADGHRRLY